jgi:hypothetical protein
VEVVDASRRTHTSMDQDNHTHIHMRHTHSAASSGTPDVAAELGSPNTELGAFGAVVAAGEAPGAAVMMEAAEVEVEEARLEQEVVGCSISCLSQL